MDAARLEEQYNRELEEMTDDVRAGFESGKYKMEDIQRVIAEKSKEACAAANKLARENPWAAVGIALGVGCVVGLLLNSRK
jgi:ElaB/YqjD/DUF883 family membrane-anchored ribosome-binding protein